MGIRLENGITYNGRHSYEDMRMILSERAIGVPNKNKITETVPFSNVEYDFSEIFGSQIYDSRELTYTFVLFNHGKIMSLEMFRVACVNWLMGTNQQSKLQDDLIEDYYFLGEVREQIDCSFEAESNTYELQVTFTCYPFKICELLEGNDLWDPFCFETDVFQDTYFDIDESQEVTIINSGVTSIVPTIICSADMTITMGTTKYLLSEGTTKAEDFMFAPGKNYMIIAGTGTVEFVFYKEIL